MESHSDTVDELRCLGLSSWGDTRPCHGVCGVGGEGINTSVGELALPIGMCDAKFANAGEFAEPQSSSSSSNSRKQDDQEAENERAAKKPKVEGAQELEGSAIGKMAPKISQIDFKRQD